MQYSQTVLIISPSLLARSQHLNDICSELETAQFGYEHYELRTSEALGLPSIDVAAILLNFPDDGHIDCAVLLKSLHATYGALTPIIGTLHNASDAAFCEDLTSAIFAPTHPVQVTRRIQSVLRISKVKNEIQMRVDTLGDISTSPPQTPSLFETTFQTLSNSQPPMRILFIGRANTEFMTIMNALHSNDVEIIAAFTSFTAFDFLQEGSFNGVVINAQDDHENALSITATMRRNSKLYNVPSLILVRSGENPDPDLMIENGVSDILTIGSSLEEISGRILELSNFHRAHATLKLMYSSLGTKESLDNETGLFNAAFFEAHLKRNFAHAKTIDAPLTMAVFKVLASNKKGDGAKLPPIAFKSALRQIGGMIKSIVRVQDCTARLSSTQFAIIFPDKTREDVSHITQRIKEIIDCTAFDTCEDAFQLSMDIKIMQVYTSKSTPSTPPLAKRA